jgi:tRNA modification GTPase
MDAADILLWLGPAGATPRPDAILLAAQCDRLSRNRPGLAVSARSGEGMSALVDALLARAATLLPKEGDFALHQRQRQQVGQLSAHLDAAQAASDLLLVAEELRLGRAAIDRLTGQASTEHMLDRLFAGFCIGK